MEFSYRLGGKTAKSIGIIVRARHYLKHSPYSRSSSCCNSILNPRRLKGGGGSI